MSVHVEWATAAAGAYEIVEAGQFTDSNGTTNDVAALLVGDGGSVCVIEGDPADFVALAHDLLAHFGPDVGDDQ